MKPFREWTYGDVKTAIDAAIARDVGKVGFEANRDVAVNHDYWRQGAGYVGPRGDRTTEARILAQVEPQFTPIDTAGEAIDNVVNGLTGTEPALAFVPLVARAETDTADPQADTMYAAVATWWNGKRLPEHYRTAAAWSRLARRGALRAWLARTRLVRPARPADLAPAAAFDDRPELPTGLAFADALAMVELSAPDPDACHVYTDPDTQERAALFLFEREREGAEHADGSRPREQAAELWFLDGDGAAVATVCRTVAADDRAVARATAYTLPLAGALPIAEMTADLLLTEPVRRQMAQANFIESVVGRTVETAGFKERTVINASPNGVWIKGAPTDGPALRTWTDTNGDIWHLREMPRVLGSSVIAEVNGHEETTTYPDGRVTKSLTTPSVTYSDPTDPAFAIRAAEHRRYTILRDCKQGHLAGTSTAEASGLAYVQARAGFAKDLQAMRGPFEAMLRDLLTAAIAIADVMTADGDPLKGFLTRYRVDVTAHVDPGPLTSDERREIRETWTGGMLAWETAVAMLGVEDVQAARAALARDPMAQLARLEQVGKTLDALSKSGSMDGALRLLVTAGALTQAEADAYAARDTDDTPNDERRPALEVAA